MSESTKGGLRPTRPSLLLGGAHLAALWALAFLQPMLSLLGDNPEFFVARGNTTSQIIIYALALAFVPPLIGLAIEAVARLINKDLQWGIHLFLMTAVGACFVLQLIKGPLDLPAGILILLSVLLAAAFVWTYDRYRFPRSFMDILSAAPIVILLVFFVFSSTSRLILPREQPDPVDVTVGNPAPVIQVIFDEFPTASLMDQSATVDGTRFPAFADPASDSTWYKNATGVGAYSPIAVPSIFTGEMPDNDELPIASDHPRSIFTLLGNTYEMQVLESVTQICPEELCPDAQIGSDSASLGDLFSDLEVVSRHLLLPDSMRRNLPDVSKTFSEFTNESEDVGESPLEETDVSEGTTGPTGTTTAQPIERTGQGAARRLGRIFALRSNEDELVRVEDFAATFDAGQSSTLDVIHVEKPHYPWRHLPSGQRYSNLTGEWSGLLPNDGPWMAPPKVVDIALQRHLLEVGYVDTLLGIITRDLKRTGLWDEAIVVVTADHGGAFQSQVPRRAATEENLGEVAAVPLFIKTPAQESAEVVTTHTCTTDVLPLVAAELEIDYPWDVAECPEDEVTVLNSPAGEATAPLDTVIAQRQRLVDRIQRVFGTGVGPTYRFGPRNDLIGQRVNQLDTTMELGRYRVLPEMRNAAKNFDPDAPGVLGLLQRGYLERFGEDKVLAVAVDGRIEAVGWTFKDGFGFGPGYSILLPPDSLKKGFNRVDIFLVEGPDRLQRVYDGSGRIPIPDGASDGT